jgi:ankyrin repeat protein
MFTVTFIPVEQVLLDAGAPKNQANTLGWTALHEACFYNRVEVVKVLLLSGANATLRTRGGALPYHLAGLQVMRAMLLEMGGPEAIPAASDTIDMVAILRELTMPEVFIESGGGKPD